MMGKMGAAAALLAVVITACGGDDGGADTTPTAQDPTNAAPTVETTQAAPSPSVDPVIQNGYTAQEVFPHIAFDEMLGMYPVPNQDGIVVVLTKGGVVYRANTQDAAQEPTVFHDIRDRMIAEPRREEGLLGLAFSPEYETTGEFYINYTAGEPRRNVISRMVSKGDAADPASETVLLEIDQPYANHNGGALAFGADGMLYIATGDGGSGGDPQGNAQNTNVLLGKILRIDVSTGGAYVAPDDNPFAEGDGLPEVWAYGLRNPWRITFDSETGDLWAGDVGENAIEEIDLIEAGGNYGWNIMEGPQCFNADSCDQAGLILPRASYARADGNCSVTGGYVYRGSTMPELDGWYVYGDFCSGTVWAFDTAEDASEPMRIAETGLAISSFAVDADGELYLVTFNNAIFRLARAG